MSILQSVPLLRRLGLAVTHFASRNLTGHAAALAYSSVLGAVPILAIVLAIARGFGFGALIEAKLADNAILSPTMTSAVMRFVDNYLEHARGGVFVGVGLLLLFYTLFNLTSNIETAFNRIWGVATSRNLWRRVVNYVSVFFFLPVIIIVTSGLQLFIAGIGRFLPGFELVSRGIQALLQLSPYLLSSLAFVVFFKMMPNTDVRWRCCVVPGIVAGAAFQGLQWSYIHSQVWLSSYDAIYGSFAAIPLFMLFVQLSWTIVLFCGALCFVRQHESSLLAPPGAVRSGAGRQAAAEAAIGRIKEIVAEYEGIRDDDLSAHK